MPGVMLHGDTCDVPYRTANRFPVPVQGNGPLPFLLSALGCLSDDSANLLLAAAAAAAGTAGRAADEVRLAPEVPCRS